MWAFPFGWYALAEVDSTRQRHTRFCTLCRLYSVSVTIQADGTESRPVVGIDSSMPERLVHIGCIFQRVRAPELRYSTPMERPLHFRMAIVHLQHNLVNERVRAVCKESFDDIVFVALDIHFDNNGISWLEPKSRLQKVGQPNGWRSG